MRFITHAPFWRRLIATSLPGSVVRSTIPTRLLSRPRLRVNPVVHPP
jgi:hypothetical protein